MTFPAVVRGSDILVEVMRRIELHDETVARVLAVGCIRHEGGHAERTDHQGIALELLCVFAHQPGVPLRQMICELAADAAVSNDGELLVRDVQGVRKQRKFKSSCD